MAAIVAAAAAPAMTSAATSAACCVCGSCASKLCCADKCCGINSANLLYFLMWLSSALASFLLYVSKRVLSKNRATHIVALLLRQVRVSPNGRHGVWPEDSAAFLL